MSELKKVRITSIDPNPFRDLNTYPWIDAKLASLKRSIKDVGFWEGVIVRKVGKRYQAAFGHHRMEAAKRSELSSIPVIIRDLSDKQMLEFMGRENGEDYSTDFVVMLNTWEGAIEFSRGRADSDSDTARLLGWTRKDTGGKNSDRINEVGLSCANAHSLINDGHLGRGDLEGLSVYQAREIVSKVRTRIDKLAQRGKKLGTPDKDIKAAQKVVASAGKRVAKKSKEGKVATKEIRREVDTESYKGAAQSRTKQSPLFSVFGDALANSIGGLMAGDYFETRMTEIEKSLGLIVMDDDRRVVDRIIMELGYLSGRANDWGKRLSKPTKASVTTFPVLEGGKK